MGCGNSSAYVGQPLRQNNNNQSIIKQNFNNNSSTLFYQMQNAKRPKFLNVQ